MEQIDEMDERADWSVTVYSRLPAVQMRHVVDVLKQEVSKDFL